MGDGFPVCFREVFNPVHSGKPGEVAGQLGGRGEVRMLSGRPRSDVLESGFNDFPWEVVNVKVVGS